MTIRPAQVRRCERCGQRISRYSPEGLCGACSRSGHSALSEPPEPLRRSSEDPASADDAGAVLRQWRLASHRTQTETADLLGMTQQHLSFIETGKRHLSIEQRRLIVSLCGIPAEDLGLSPARHASAISDDTEVVIASQLRWRAERRWLNQHRSQLARLAVGLYPADQRVGRSPLIAKQGWIPEHPVPLRSFGLTLDHEDRYPVTIDGSEPATQAMRPLRTADEFFDSYTAAVWRLDPPRLFENRPSYRLLEASLPARQLGFGMACYFDKLDVSEALGHEIAARCMTRPGGMPEAADVLHGKLPFRELIGDPFDTHRRAVIPAVTTLTIRLRRYPAEPSFLLHWRDPAKVATAAGIYDVVPAGEFQPSSLEVWDRDNDFDLWKNVVREYSEELLGRPEHDGTRSKKIDYGSWELYQALEAAQAAGTMTVHLLGIGLDSLTLAGTILTVAVIDDDVFLREFGKSVRYNEEGEIVALGDGRPVDGLPFTRPVVDRMLSAEPMASPGAACMSLAWHHRDLLIN